MKYSIERKSKHILNFFSLKLSSVKHSSAELHTTLRSSRHCKLFDIKQTI